MANEPALKMPKGEVRISKSGRARLIYNKDYVNKFNTNATKLQVFTDERIARNLMNYVSYKTGTQEKSILLSTDFGSGKVRIGVPYARTQAYSKRIKKRDGNRGTYPFERMKMDKKATILRQIAAYSRRINDG